MVAKKQREKLYPKFTSAQLEVLNSLVPQMANSPSETVSRIVVMWLFDKGYLKPNIKAK